MKNYRLTAARDNNSVAMVMTDTETGAERVEVYPAEQTYPLLTDRYHNELGNLFVDLLDVVAGFGPEGVKPGSNKKAQAAAKDPSVTLRTLTRRAVKVVSDGSGSVGSRYVDARDLWTHMEQQALALLVQHDAPAVTDVLKGNNWRKAQPLAHTRIDPQAWYVVNVYSRSNVSKDPITCYRGVTALLEALVAEFGESSEVAEQVASLRKSMNNDLDFPTYRQISRLVKDSNMLVFHNDQQLADWIRSQASGSLPKAEQAVNSDTPALVKVRSWRGPQMVVGDQQASTDQVNEALDELKDGKPVTVANLANRLAPRVKAAAKKASRKAGASSSSSSSSASSRATGLTKSSSKAKTRRKR